jgi:hypothetical protein
MARGAYALRARREYSIGLDAWPTMNFILHPWHLLIYILASRFNQHEQNAIDYLRTENQILRKKLGKRRIFLTAEECTAKSLDLQ